MKAYEKFALALGLFVLFSGVTFAQLPAPSIDQVQTELQTDTIFGNQSQAAVTGAPYSAIEERLYSQKQRDGAYEDRSLITTHIYRDWQGRTRAERYETSYLPGAGEARLTSIIIADPLAGVIDRLEPENQRASRIPWNSRVFSVDTNTPGKVVSSAEVQPRATTKSLGNSTMEGVAVEGTLQTLTVPVGAHGNERPFTIVVETWISPELKISVLSKRDNSIIGLDTTRLTKIDRSDPDPALFQVPADYEIVEPLGAGDTFVAH